MRGPFLRVLIGGVALLGAAALVWVAGAQRAADSDQRADREHPIVTAPRVAMQDGNTVIRLDAAALARAAIRTEPVQRRPQAETVRAYATVVDPQPLADLSAAMQTAAAQLAGARAKLAASQAEYERAQRLFDDQQNVSAAQVQTAQAAFLADQSALAAAQAQVEAARTSARLSWGPLLARALAGSDAGAGTLAADLLTRRRVLLQVALPPDAAGDASPPRGRLLLEGREGPEIRFLAPAARADPRIAGRAALYLAPPDAALAPAASVPVLLATGHSVDAASIPASAVVWWQGRAWIFVRTRAGDFERRELPVEHARDASALLADVASGTEVVVQGAQVLLSEELRAENSSTDVGGR
jgi:hypothetical protein